MRVATVEPVDVRSSWPERSLRAEAANIRLGSRAVVGPLPESGLRTGAGRGPAARRSSALGVENVEALGEVSDHRLPVRLRLEVVGVGPSAREIAVHVA